MPTRLARGFTIVELAGVLAVTTGCGSLLVVSMGSGDPPTDVAEEIKQLEKDLDDVKRSVSAIEGRLANLKSGTPSATSRAVANQLKDASQVRGISQSMIIWSQNNNDRYPLPSKIDREDKTVAGKGVAKDTTANIFSLLIFNGFVPPEMCVTPSEVNPNIVADEDYAYDAPKAAVDPAQAAWDPSFAADFTAGQGNVSYAHLQPFGGKLRRWSSTFNASDAQVSNRGPEIASVHREPSGVSSAVEKNKSSNTHRIHGAPEAWEGNVAYGDNHVTFETTYLPPGPPNARWADAQWARYTLVPAAGARPDESALDCYFFDEPDAKDGNNLFLSIFAASGPESKDWKPIWD